jgi:hypothetical protein
MSNAAQANLRQFLAERCHRSHPVEGMVSIGNPSTEILRAAAEWKAALLMLGSHGRRGISRLILGSTAAAVIGGATCNALVIPAALAAAHSKGTASAVVEPLAAVIGAAAVLAVQPVLPYALAFAAGAMVYVVVVELIPGAHQGGGVPTSRRPQRFSASPS